MQIQGEQHDHMQIVKFKGKRTKRQRLPSPLRLAMNEDLLSHFGISHHDKYERSLTENSGGFDVAITSSPIASMEFMNRSEEEEEEEEDMANCLILLAQGNRHTQKPSSQSHHVAAHDHENNNNNKKANSGLYLYECKTCNRCFPSFQALGGHRASHKKANNAQEKQAVITTTNFVNDHYYDPTSTTLTLQISNNRALYGTTTSTRTSNTKSKVHECSICGAEFTSGQALGGHMRRHRSILSTSTTTCVNRANNIGGGTENLESVEPKRPRNVLKLDLNLPAPHEDDQRESKLPFQSKEKVIVFSATNSLVDCHY